MRKLFRNLSAVFAFFLLFSLYNSVNSETFKQTRKQDKIPILLYHHINTKNSRFSVSPENFRKQLQKLYDAGFVTVKLEEVIENRLPRDRRAVVITFDDGNISQFNYKNGQIDRDSAVGILNEFYEKHPDFGRHAIFFLAPGTRNMVFGQRGMEKKKLEELLRNEMEIGNHTFTHERFINASPDFVAYQLGAAMQKFESYIGRDAENIRIVALPFGDVPKNAQAQRNFREFDYKGRHYRNIGIRFAYGRYNRYCSSPESDEFNPYELPSLEVTNTNIDTLIKNAQ